MYKKIAFFIFFVFLSGYGFSDTTMCKTRSLVADYDLNSYTCDTGYFLPADTLGCRACPSGYGCEGGTFYYNPTNSQGLVRNTDNFTQNVLNSCSLNMRHVMVAVFSQNETITVNFQNGENTESVTCIYGDELTLPEPPTRVGYTFTGWKVKNAE